MTSREVVRDMLARRYHGAIEPTEAMIDAVLGELAGQDTSQPQTGLTQVTTAAQLTAGTPILAWGYQASVVAHRPDLGGYVVAMAGEDGTTPGEQWVTPEDDLEEPPA
jgi:hypothetical protein